ncbi:hypothetical protein VIA_001041 [Vibrio orientalis CIP 102891 = ATCC 33934]|uniref:Uncharacterized protein n=1 Tax=Vibrio orientalis CIP 102891 = ATCC 33934 TaxID=675816 RepID=A0ABM9Z2H2_VIBOR|nr:hypothetical protein VIA_001041 [Vibrio orientalis CIP 102891 = ATCC 33934]
MRAIADMSSVTQNRAQHKESHNSLRDCCKFGNSSVQTGALFIDI